MKKLHGVTTAMITPFDEEGKINLEAVAELTEFLIEKGVNCLYPLGTTGEFIRLTVEERKKIAETIVKTADSRVTVYIHVGAANEEDVIDLAKHAYSIGADGIGVVTPYYLKLNEKELSHFFVRIAKSVPEDFGVYLYNIFQLSSNDITVKVVNNVINQCPNVMGIKYSYPDFMRTQDYIYKTKSGFSVLQGADSLFVPSLAMGCDGTVSGISCVFPEPYVAIYEAFKKGDLEKAREYQQYANAFCDALKAGLNMNYFKAGLKLRGIEVGNMRNPHQPLTKEENKILRETILKFIEEGKSLLSIHL